MKRRVDLLAAGVKCSMVPLVVVPAPKKPVRKTVNPLDLKRNAQRALDAFREGIPRWYDMDPRDLVGLHLVIHEHVNDVDDPMSSKELSAACAMAGHLVAKLGTMAVAVDFVRWAWARNVGRNRWAESNGREPFRLTWFALASNKTVADYLVCQKTRATR